MKKKTTYKELFEVVNVIGQLKGEETKLTKKCVRFMKNIKPLIEDYNDAITVINEEFALTDDTKKGAFILDEKGSYTFNKEVNAWCQENICADMYFAFQIMNGNLGIHKDFGTKTKLIYLLELGGENVITNFYEDDKITVTHSYVIESHRWHILKADSYHSVINVEPGKYRFSITGRVFPD